MTISIFLPVGDKSEKTPFMDVQVHPTQTQPPLPKNAKFLEIRDGGLPNTNNNDYGPSKPFKMIYWMHRPIDYVKLIKKLSMFIAFILIFLGTLVILYIYDKSEIDSFKKMNCEQQQDTKDDDSPQKDIDLTKMTLLPVPDYLCNESKIDSSGDIDREQQQDTMDDDTLQEDIELNMADIFSFPESYPQDLNSIIIMMQLEKSEKMSHYPIKSVIEYEYNDNIADTIDSENTENQRYVEPPESLSRKPITTSVTYYSWKTDKFLNISEQHADYQIFRMEKNP